MRRRGFLTLGVGTAGVLAGCSSRSGSPTETQQSPSEQPPGSGATDTPSHGTNESPTESGRQDETTLFVGPNGRPDNPGTREQPFKHIQRALKHAQPGDTVYVKPGQYFQSVHSMRAGKEGAPITITGPPDAVVSGAKQEWSGGFLINHGHIHIRGLTIDGLQDPSNPDDVDSYMNIAIHTNGENMSGPVIRGLVYKPHAIGNVREAMITLGNVKDVEVGEFRVIGPCGLEYLFGAERGHFGEIVYVGTGPKPAIAENVHIHHIDNSAGHGFIELVDTKPGSKSVVAEYCTAVGARLPSDNDHSSAVHLGGQDATFRWNRIVEPVDRAIDVGNYGIHPDLEQAATDNAIYGNELLRVPGKKVWFTEGATRAEQRVVCGNVIGETPEVTPEDPCPSDVPQSDGVGHTGGDSPW